MQKETNDDDDDEEFLSPEEQPKKEVTKKVAPSKLWSFVSTILRFASLTQSPDTAMDLKSSKENSFDSPAIIKRCASMAGNNDYFLELSFHHKVSSIDLFSSFRRRKR